MRFSNLTQHLEAFVGTAGATRRVWKHQAYVIMGYSGRLYIVIDCQNLPYALSFEDATADDWEPL